MLLCNKKIQKRHGPPASFLSRKYYQNSHTSTHNRYGVLNFRITIEKTKNTSCNLLRLYLSKSIIFNTINVYDT